ncbi:F0F1 ATP synthase subunit B [Litorivicinus lipolyticus]|uniref:ATP synthase subunit b n=1 Tax=Litorivicinus lipolyticus TaxID=418701 RepID=A0A5Q2Q805_9GAMM|nr:F0F1 ATP synthase subunit B [Litorivicinus lipolyticus]QGG79133.1 F0F1 ATP synthase subunit B [Litorivicinus lipolyticus]
MNLNLTLLGQLISFAIFVWFCMKFVWPPVMAALNERQERIAQGLADADKAAKELDVAQARIEEQVREAKEDASRILEQARKQAAQTVEDAQGKARAEGEKLIEQAKADIEQEVNAAREALRAQVSTLAVAGAAKILGTAVDAKAHGDLIDQLAKEL